MILRTDGCLLFGERAVDRVILPGGGGSGLLDCNFLDRLAVVFHEGKISKVKFTLAIFLFSLLNYSLTFIIVSYLIT
jgi:hypothetical protein